MELNTYTYGFCPAPYIDDALLWIVHKVEVPAIKKELCEAMAIISKEFDLTRKSERYENALQRIIKFRASHFI
jgi:hypothetical protein